jgi:hypothetical protein
MQLIVSFTYSMGYLLKWINFFSAADAIINLRTQRLNTGYYFTTSRIKCLGRTNWCSSSRKCFDPGNYFCLLININLGFKLQISPKWTTFECKLDLRFKRLSLHKIYVLWLLSSNLIFPNQYKKAIDDWIYNSTPIQEKSFSCNHVW